jgi:hypothetical protein
VRESRLFGTSQGFQESARYNVSRGFVVAANEYVFIETGAVNHGDGARAFRDRVFDRSELAQSGSEAKRGRTFFGFSVEQ